jgi:hypothetical protein
MLYVPDWPSHLPRVLLGLSAASKEFSIFSLVEAVVGQPLVLPGELTPGEEALVLAFGMSWPLLLLQVHASLIHLTKPLSSSRAKVANGPLVYCMSGGVEMVRLWLWPTQAHNGWFSLA